MHRRLEDLEGIRAHRQALLKQRRGKLLEIVIEGLIDQIRAERGAELLSVVFGGAK